jgi:membrane-associated phospholipid phosphatase
MALTLTDVVLAAYNLFLAVVIVARGPLTDGHAWLLLAVLLFGLLLMLFRRASPLSRFGAVVHTFYPLVLFGGLYTALGVLNEGLDPARIPANDAIIQAWEGALFGGQPSYDLIREHPSVFLSGLLHLAYFSYYPTIIVPPPLLAARGDWDGARHVIGASITAYILCFVVFTLFPVAGPNWVWDHPTGPVRDVWSARLVYTLLEGGSSVGTAFPSSHVAATFATVIAAWRAWPPLGRVTVVPFALLTIAVVYCQMHYALDALVGLAFGAAAAVGAEWMWRSTGREFDRSKHPGTP